MDFTSRPMDKTASRLFRCFRGIWRFGAFLAICSSWHLNLQAAAEPEGITIRAETMGLSIPLVRHDTTWKYFKGRSEPRSDWKTAPDSAFGNAWSQGPGGFGYAHGDDLTVLDDMRGSYSTVYIRKTFNVESIPPGTLVKLVADFDDGFIAYLDGKEIVRHNAPGIVDAPSPYNATAQGGHEATSGNSERTPETYLLGPAAQLLTPGPHILAIQGFNDRRNSEDFSLIVNLLLVDAHRGEFFTSVAVSEVTLEGEVNVEGATDVRVNQQPAEFIAGGKKWRREQPLTNGLNRLDVEVLDHAGVILASRVEDIVSLQRATFAGGTAAADTRWAPEMGVILVKGDVVVSTGQRLTIEPGTTVLMMGSASLRGTNSGTINVEGAPGAPCYVLPGGGRGHWGAFSAWDRAKISATHTEFVGGQLQVWIYALGTFEDCVIRDYHEGYDGIIWCGSGRGGTHRLILKRCHITRFYQMAMYRVVVEIEECLIENSTEDGIDFDFCPPGSFIRNSTIRHGKIADSDALDFGAESSILIENCLIYDYGDKGISAGEVATNIVLRNSVIHHVPHGVALKGDSTAHLYNNTIANCSYGVRCYDKSGGTYGGHARGSNNIIWNNQKDVSIEHDGSAQFTYSVIGGTGKFPGMGNMNVDPRFAAPADGEYRLAPGSPLAAPAPNGLPYGAVFPVGGIPIAPSSLESVRQSNGSLLLTWADRSTNETGFQLGRSLDGIRFVRVGKVGPDETNLVDSQPVIGRTNYYRVRALNVPGDSDFSMVHAMFAKPAVVPGTPFGLEAEFAGGSVFLSWTNGGADQDAIWIEASTNDVSWEFLAISGTATNHTFTNVAAGSTNFYRVYASNLFGVSPRSSAVQISIPQPVMIPMSPQHLSAAFDSDGVHLAWIDSSTNESEFVIESSSNDSSWTQLAKVSAGTTNWLIKSIRPNQIYRYRVLAQNSAGASEPTALRQIETGPEMGGTISREGGNRQIDLQLECIPGERYTLQTSPDLVIWQWRTNFIAPAAIWTVRQPLVPGRAQEFFRLQKGF